MDSISRPVDSSPSKADSSRDAKHTALQVTYQHVLDHIQKAEGQIAKPNVNRSDGRVFLSNLRSTTICWGCDIRVETNSLESIRNTMFESVIRSSFDRMVDLLQRYKGSGSSEDLALQSELEQCARRLESFVSPIRMSQVISTGGGPLDGMRRKITELSELPQKRSDPAIRTPLREKAYIIALRDDLAIGLGSIITDPFDPDTRVLRKEGTDNMPQLMTVPISGELVRKKLLEEKATILQTYLRMAGFRSDPLGVSNKDTLLDRAKFESMETRSFKPNNTYLSKALSSRPVQEYLDRRGTAPMYIITGVKVVRGVRGIERGQKKIKADVGIDASPLGVPVSMGPDVAASSKQETLSSGTSSDLVYAYQVSQITGGHTTRKIRSREIDKGALFSDEQDDADADELDISSWEIKNPEVDSLEEQARYQYGDELAQMVLCITKDEC